MVPETRMGIYRHYKGPLYQVLGLAHDANAEQLFTQDSKTLEFFTEDDRVVVVYFALELNPGHLGPRLAVRTREDFHFPHYCRTGGKVQECGPGCTWADHHIPRFRYLGPELTKEMLSGNS